MRLTRPAASPYAGSLRERAHTGSYLYAASAGGSLVKLKREDGNVERYASIPPPLGNRATDRMSVKGQEQLAHRLQVTEPPSQTQ